MVSTASSAWLKMERGLRTFSVMLFVLQILAVVLAVASLVVFAFSGTLELSWVVAAVLVIALAGLRRFCEGSMERLRQLSQLV